MIGKREKERRVKYLRTKAVVLKSLVLDLKKSAGIDMSDEIIGFFEDRFKEARK